MDIYRIELTRAYPWYVRGDTAVVGAAFAAGALLSGPALHRWFDEAEGEADFVARVAALDGFFAVVRTRGAEVLVAVDRVRSYPLFWAQVDGRLHVADDAARLHDHLRGGPPSPVALAEFLRTGYVTGADTLSPAVRQLQAGEALLRPSAGGPARPRRWFTLRHEARLPDDEEALLALLDERLLQAFERLVRFAAGRQVVVPLSGGYDSRLVALQLRRLGCPNLVAYTYGRAGNREAKVSRHVAAVLDLPWHFAEYSHAGWRRWYRSAERRSFFERAHDLVSLPHIQECPALPELRRRGALERGGVVVPGHTGDFISGGHVLPALASDEAPTPAAVVRAIYAKHFRYNLGVARSPEVDAEVRRRIERHADLPATLDPEAAVDAAERWEWQERQAKFIVNSVRVYEHHGHAWWMPLWDGAVVDFWAGVPLAQRLGQRLYRTYVDRLYARVTGRTPRELPRPAARGLPGPDGDRPSLRRRLAGAAHRVPAFTLLNDYFRNPFAWGGIMDLPRFLRLGVPGQHVNAYIALDVAGLESLE